MKSILSVILFVFLLSVTTFSQHSISGIVTDPSGVPVFPANVFLANSQIGTTTLEDGTFELTDVPNGPANLVVSYVGFEHWDREIIIHDKALSDIQIRLRPSAIELGEVSITAKSSNKRKRYLRRFENAFLGESRLAKKCSLRNPEVLLFEEKDGRLLATANKLLEIENLGTGYLVLFSLEKFEAKGNDVVYAGKPLFQEITPENDKQRSEWEDEREKAYLGSRTHFIRSLMNDELEKEGYKISLGQLDAKAQFANSHSPKTQQIMTPGATDYDKILMLEDFLKVEYKNEISETPLTPVGGISLGADHEPGQMGGGKANFRNQTSYLYALKSKVKIYTDGRVAQPHLLKEYGHFASERIAELLPNDYVANGGGQQVPVKKGFLLSGLSIELEAIKDGGPPKDGIPSIDKPVFLSSFYAKYLQNDNLVLGVEYNGVAKAYPIRILNWHEIVNDNFAGKKVAVTYCPLCGSGMAFNTEQIGELGVSGLLYNSDVLLYDRQTESLWSQILGKSVAGPSSGQAFEYINTTLTTWKKWQSMHPKTMVLSTNTGYERDYAKDPYKGYEETEKLMFPVANKSAVLHAKEKVIGVEVGGEFKAYSYSALAAANSPIKDNFNGKILSIDFDKKSKTAVVKEDGKISPSVSMYWFAWYAFHPETEVHEE